MDGFRIPQLFGIFVLFHFGLCGRAETLVYHLEAIWYPNITNPPHAPSTCPLLIPGEDSVLTDFRGTFTLPGAALQLQAGQYADVTPNDVTTTDDVTICWIFQLRGGGSGTVVEFVMENGETMEAVMDSQRGRIITYLHGLRTGSSSYDSDPYEKDDSDTWSTVAYVFNSRRSDYMLWNGGKQKSFDEDEAKKLEEPLIPTSVRLGTSTQGNSNSRMEIACLMLFTIENSEGSDTFVKSISIPDMLTHCDSVTDSGVLGCVDGQEPTTTTTTTTTTTEPTTTTTTTEPSTTTTTTEPSTTTTTEPSTTTSTTEPSTTTTTTEPSTTTTTTEPSTTTTAAQPSTMTTNAPSLTTIVSQIVTSIPECRCVVNVANFNHSKIDDDKYAKELLVEMSALSSTRRKKESAKDVRPSSRYVGSVGIAVLTFTGVLILFFDML